MNSRVKIMIFLLAAALVFSAILLVSCAPGATPSETEPPTSDSSETSESEESTSEAVEDISIVSNGKSDYVIVRSDNAGKDTINTVVAFRAKFKELTGIELPIISDYEGKGGIARTECEILIGDTNRSDEVDYPDRSAYGYGGFSVSVSGKRLVLYASGTAGLSNATEYFLSMLAENPTLLKFKGDYLYMDAKKLTPDQIFDIADRTDLVAICYSTWFNPILEQSNNNPADISEVLAGKRDWGYESEFHYWSRPELGYYRSDDKTVIRTHMTQLAEANVDFIIVDNTNANVLWKNSIYQYNGQSRVYWNAMISESCTALLDTIVEMREEGLKTPYVVMWCQSNDDYETLDAIYEEFYTNEKYADCWVYWDEKPFLLGTKLHEKRDDITLRKMWGLQSSLSASEWSFLNVPNVVSYAKDGSAEQVCVCVAAQKSYMSLPSATGRRGGLTFYEQWQVAFKARPKVVTLTWWNEWAAQRFVVNGETRFVDNYTPEYSRDIEPMAGGHGDTYYQWMKQYIAAYKAGEACPKLVNGSN